LELEIQTKSGSSISKIIGIDGRSLTERLKDVWVRCTLVIGAVPWYAPENLQQIFFERYEQRLKYKMRREVKS
jgi:hypothetical protein